MLTGYFIKLIVVMPVMAGLIVAALWLYRKYGLGAPGARTARRVDVIETTPLGAMAKLMVVRFDGKDMLLSVSRHRVERLTEPEAAR